jgi:pimeloyl-ACP methyl ester carboxylesterase
MMSTTAYTDREVTVGDLTLHYQEWGDPAGEPIVMLHGFGVSGHMFDEFADRLQGSYRLLALDQRGHGDSSWAEDGDYSRDSFVADVEGFRKALGLDSFILVGHSMGGLNAVSYVNAHPQRVRSLILVDVGPEAAKEGVDNIVRFTRGPDELDFDEFVEMAHRFNQRRTIENIRERMRHRLKQLENGKWTWKFDSRFRQQDGMLKIGSDLTNDQVWALYRSIKCPVLLVRGAESDVLTQEVADRCVREMQRARLVVVPGAGHSVPGDNPDAFTEAVRTFLDDVAAGKFEPAVEASPPPLADLVTEQDRAEHRRRRGGGLALLVLAGGALAIGAAVFAGQRRKKRSAQQTRRPARIADVTHVARHVPADLALARARAAALADELGVAGRRSAGRAKAILSEADLEHARASASAVLAALGDVSRTAPSVAAARGKQVAKRAKKRRRGGVGTALAIGTFAARLLLRQRKKNRGGALAVWRR